MKSLHRCCACKYFKSDPCHLIIPSYWMIKVMWTSSMSQSADGSELDQHKTVSGSKDRPDSGFTAAPRAKKVQHNSLQPSNWEEAAPSGSDRKSLRCRRWALSDGSGASSASLKKIYAVCAWPTASCQCSCCKFPEVSKSSKSLFKWMLEKLMTIRSMEAVWRRKNTGGFLFFFF